MPNFLEILEKGFIEFLERENSNLTIEFLLPIFIGKLLKENRIKIKVLETKDKWFGITYKEDKEFVKSSFKKLIEKGEYNKDLFDESIYLGVSTQKNVLTPFFSINIKKPPHDLLKRWLIFIFGGSDGNRTRVRNCQRHRLLQV